MEFLAEIGPDALINTFVVNLKNDDGTINTNIDVANALQTDIFKELSGCVGLSPKRIPMFLTTSHFNSKKYGKALDDFKRRLGVCTHFSRIFVSKPIVLPLLSRCYSSFGDFSNEAFSLGEFSAQRSNRKQLDLSIYFILTM